MIVRLHGRQIERQIIQYTCLDAVTHMQKMNHLSLVVGCQLNRSPVRGGRGSRPVSNLSRPVSMLAIDCFGRYRLFLANDVQMLAPLQVG
jgi:hypothetical protein